MIQIPESVKELLNRLNKAGFEAYLVGGCVRDTIMGKVPFDWDICTNALPLEVKAVFSEYHVIETGLQHGTVTVVINRMPIEVTTYRTDGEYKDHRRPLEVEFVRDLQEDLARRDFTINALAYHPETGIIDYYNGQKDIEHKIIRCVGNASDRFEEDALRILRALRFSSRLGFMIADEVKQAIYKKKKLLNDISKERIYSEFCGILMGQNVVGVLLEYREIIAAFIPEIIPTFDFVQNHPYHQYDVYRHTVETVGAVAEDLSLRLAMFFHDIGKPSMHTRDEKGIDHFYEHADVSVDITRKVFNRLKVDNETKHRVLLLIQWHDASIRKRKILSWLNRLGEGTFRQLLKVQRADILGQAKDKQKERLKELEEIEKALELELEKGSCFSLSQLEIDGRDLIELGIPKGKDIGLILESLLQEVIEEKTHNDKEELKRRAVEITKE